MKLEKFDGTKTYMFPNGLVATPDVIREKYPATNHFTFVIGAEGNVCKAILDLNQLRYQYQISDAVSDDEAIIAIQSAKDAEQAAQQAAALAAVSTPTTDERIAAALEFLAINGMTDVTPQ